MQCSENKKRWNLRVAVKRMPELRSIKLHFNGEFSFIKPK